MVKAHCELDAALWKTRHCRATLQRSDRLASAANVRVYSYNFGSVLVQGGL